MSEKLETFIKAVASLKKVRENIGIALRDEEIAQKLQITPAQLSAILKGTAPMPVDLPDRFNSEFGLKTVRLRVSRLFSLSRFQNEEERDRRLSDTIGSGGLGRVTLREGLEAEYVFHQGKLSYSIKTKRNVSDGTDYPILFYSVKLFRNKAAAESFELYRQYSLNHPIIRYGPWVDLQFTSYLSEEIASFKKALSISNP